MGSEQSLSRRELLGAIGGAALGLSLPALLAADQFPEEAESALPSLSTLPLAQTLEELRSQAGGAPLYFLSEKGKEGFFLHDPADRTSSDNTGTVIVTEAGLRYKRLLHNNEVNITWFGADSSPDTDNTAFIREALHCGAPVVIIPSGDFIIRETLLVPNKVVLRGSGPLSQLVKQHNGFMLQLSDQAQLQNLRLFGNGKTFSGGGVLILSGNNQTISNCSITHTESYCIEYRGAAVGATSTIESCVLYTDNKSQVPAVKYPDNEVNGDRKLLSIDCNGGLLADFAGCSTVLITNCNTIGVLFRANSKKVSMIGNRLAGGTAGLAVKLRGMNHVIVGNMSATAIEIGSGVNHCVILGNLAKVLDESQSNTNYIDTQMTSFTAAARYGHLGERAELVAFGAGGKHPNGGSIAFGDGSGWNLNIGTSAKGAFVPLFSFSDTGCLALKPMDASKAVANSLFIDKSDGHLKFKPSFGSIQKLY